MTLRQRVIELLDRKDWDALRQAASEGGIMRLLVSLTYDKASLRSWRAIEAVGLVAGDLGRSDPDAVRNLSQRLLWMLREESGNNPWSVPDLLGEIVRNNPEDLADLAPIITSFCDEEILKSGVMRATVRIAEIRPELIEERGRSLAGEFISDKDPLVRAYALILAGLLGVKEMLPAVEALRADDGPIMLYHDGELTPSTVGKIADQTAILLRA